MLIRPALDSDQSAIWSILEPVIRAGETYTFAKDMSEHDAIADWCSRDKETFVAAEGSEILGTYYMRPNQTGGGSHICNCAYVTRSTATGRGVARRMCEHSLQHARQRGYRGMQFNFVVSTNTRAVELWHSLGFKTVGRLPGVFKHPSLNYVDALVMFQAL